jgi:hypothetical protein
MQEAAANNLLVGAITTGGVHQSIQYNLLVGAITTGGVHQSI